MVVDVVIALVISLPRWLMSNLIVGVIQGLSLGDICTTVEGMVWLKMEIRIPKKRSHFSLVLRS